MPHFARSRQGHPRSLCVHHSPPSHQLNSQEAPVLSRKPTPHSLSFNQLHPTLNATLRSAPHTLRHHPLSPQSHCGALDHTVLGNFRQKFRSLTPQPVLTCNIVLPRVGVGVGVVCLRTNFPACHNRVPGQLTGRLQIARPFGC